MATGPGGGNNRRPRSPAGGAVTMSTGAGELPQTAAVMGGVLDALLQRTLSSMAGRWTDRFLRICSLGSFTVVLRRGDVCKCLCLVTIHPYCKLGQSFVQ